MADTGEMRLLLLLGGGYSGVHRGRIVANLSSKGSYAWGNRFRGFGEDLLKIENLVDYVSYIYVTF